MRGLYVASSVGQSHVTTVCTGHVKNFSGTKQNTGVCDGTKQVNYRCAR